MPYAQDQGEQADPGWVFHKHFAKSALRRNSQEPGLAANSVVEGRSSLQAGCVICQMLQAT